jgi:hypothetical protein
MNLWMTKMEDICLRLDNGLATLRARVAEIAAAQTHLDAKMVEVADSQAHWSAPQCAHLILSWPSEMKKDRTNAWTNEGLPHQYLFQRSGRGLHRRHSGSRDVLRIWQYSGRGISRGRRPRRNFGSTQREPKASRFLNQATDRLSTDSLRERPPLNLGLQDNQRGSKSPQRHLCRSL